MKRLLLLLLLLPLGLHAEMVARDQIGNWVKLLNEPCTASAWMQKDWKKAELFYDGRQYKACWRLANAEVYLLDAAGDVSIIPAYAFKQETGT